MQVDSEWSVRTPKGFRWWADKNAQTVEVVGQETGPDGQMGYHISVRTELLQSLDLGDREIAILNATPMQMASMSGPVYEAQTKIVSLASLVRVYDGISQWMNPIIGLAAALQIDEARTVAKVLTETLGAKAALSGPPGRGMRPVPHKLAGISARSIAPAGKRPSQWPPAEFQDTVDKYMNRPPSLLATCGGAGFTVEFPFGDQSSLCQVKAYEPHPLYGNGLFLLQSFPITINSDSEGAKLAFTMNHSELMEKPFGYGFGSYAYRDRMLHFTSFFPNAMYRPGLLPNLYFSCAMRAREMSLRLANDDWSQATFSPKQSAIGQVLFHKTDK